MKVISIDIGATSGRVMTVMEKDGILTYEENLRFPNKIIEEENTYYWDFPLLLSHVRLGIQKALTKYNDIKSLSIDTWGVDYGILSSEGKLKGNPLCYRDEHSYQKQKELLSLLPFEKIYQKVGIQNLHFNTIYQLYKDERIEKGDKILLIPDLIAYFLTGFMRMEETNASTTSLYDSQKKKLDEELLSLLSLDSSYFPKMIFPKESYGCLKEEYYPKEYCGKKIEVVACCSHDTASAVLGTDGFGDFAYLSSGTWSLLGTELETPILTLESQKANFTNEIGYGGKVRYLKNTMGMFLINETRKEFKEKGLDIPVSKIKECVESSEDIDSFLDVDDPLFETPGGMIKKIDDYLKRTKQEIPKKVGQYLRIIYQSMALSYRKKMDDLERLVGHTLSTLIIVGGGNQASVLNQFTANALKRKVITGPIEATVLGNALVQFFHHGVYQSVDEGRKAIEKSIVSETYLPLEEERWNQKIEKFKRIEKR